jgi:flagellar biosynthesis regulator FlbT
MKTILLAILAFSMLNVQAEEKKGSGEKFQKAKSMMLEKIEKRISNLQDVKSCVSSASDKEALKACRAKMKEHRAEMKEQRKQWKEKRKQRKQRRKKNQESDE